MLVAENLIKSYRGRDVVRDVSLEVHRGKVVGLLGPNGAGKTTCFYMIVGLVPVDGGQILVDGHNVTRKAMNVRARHGIGYLPQDASIFRKLSVRDNILSIVEIAGNLNREERLNETGRLMEELQVSHLAEQTGISLSGGERRRVEIARALAAKPHFILLDEPFAGIDPISVGDIQRIVCHLVEQEIGVLITDHNVRETLSICDHAYILNEGKMLAAGKPADLLKNAEVRHVYLGDDFTL